MQTKTTSTRMRAIIDLYDMQTKYFNSALDGFKEEEGHNWLKHKSQSCSLTFR